MLHLKMRNITFHADDFKFPQIINTSLLGDGETKREKKKEKTKKEFAPNCLSRLSKQDNFD